MEIHHAFTDPRVRFRRNRHWCHAFRLGSKTAGGGDEPTTIVAEGVGEDLDKGVRLDTDPIARAERGGLRGMCVEHQKHRRARRHAKHQLVAQLDQHGIYLSPDQFVSF